MYGRQSFYREEMCSLITTGKKDLFLHSAFDVGVLLCWTRNGWWGWLVFSRMLCSLCSISLSITDSKECSFTQWVTSFAQEFAEPVWVCNLHTSSTQALLRYTCFGVWEMAFPIFSFKTAWETVLHSDENDMESGTILKFCTSYLTHFEFHYL